MYQNSVKRINAELISNQMNMMSQVFPVLFLKVSPQVVVSNTYLFKMNLQIRMNYGVLNQAQSVNTCAFRTSLMGFQHT